MMELVMMEEESEKLAAKPEVSYFGTGRRTAGHAATGVCVQLFNQICDTK